MTDTGPREQEAKFQVDPARLPTLQIETIELTGYTLQPIGIKDHIDTYLDTPAYDLLRHGLSLRVRQEGTAAEIGIKSLEVNDKDAIQDRLEMAFPLSANDDPFEVGAWPTAIRKQLDVTPRVLKALRPLVSLRQHRQKCHLLTAATHEPFAEWSLDEVWIFREAEGVETPLAHFHELEIELLAPAPESTPDTDETPETSAAFTGLVAQVQDQFDLTPIHTSKAVRGMEAMLMHIHDGADALAPQMELADACRLLLHQQLMQIMLNEQGVRAGEEADFVHEMRMAIRRARAAIRLFGDAFEPGALASYQKGLKRLGRALGDVRDLDVALANLRDFRHSQPEDQHKGSKALRKALKKRRAHAHTALLALLDSPKYRKFIVRFDTFCATPGAETAKAQGTAHEHPPTQVRHTLPSIIVNSFEAVRAYEVAFSSPVLPPLETFHALRIQGKSLRYLLEFSQHLLGPSGADLIAQIKELLEHLGQLNDAHVEQERLHLWNEKMQNDDSLDETIEARLAEIDTRITELTTTFPPCFANFVSPDNRKRLGIAIAHL
ncbi:MAG: CHAD domain-containing protein [Caldilineaceae bacterium]|nr:CHAD domain-containing protein [Caldilineaceae bacterium]